MWYRTPLLPQVGYNADANESPFGETPGVLGKGKPSSSIRSLKSGVSTRNVGLLIMASLLTSGNWNLVCV